MPLRPPEPIDPILLPNEWEEPEEEVDPLTEAAAGVAAVFANITHIDIEPHEALAHAQRHEGQILDIFRHTIDETIDEEERFPIGLYMPIGGGGARVFIRYLPNPSHIEFSLDEQSDLRRASCWHRFQNGLSLISRLGTWVRENLLHLSQNL